MPYGSVLTDSITDSSGGVLAPSSSVFRNRIINGDMRIDQRNAGASLSAVTDTNYCLDRWAYRTSQNSKYSIQRNAGSVTPPSRFSNYLGITSSSAYSLLSGDYFGIEQKIEGFNCSDLAWGTASAATVTLSFWVRSSLTGTFGGSIFNGANNRSYPFTYSIASANTWTSISITILGDTSGTWPSDNTACIRVCFGIGVGSTYSGTAGAWAGSLYLSATGATSVVGTNGATFYITGVQLEKGSTATSFDFRNYQAELAMCQRYYYRISPAATNKILGSAQGYNATTGGAQIPFPTTMRIAPTALEQSGTASNYQMLNSAGSTVACSSVPTFNASTTDSMAFVNTITASGLAAGIGSSMLTNSSAAYLGWSAEL
jgi:hypothetical protein